MILDSIPPVRRFKPPLARGLAAVLGLLLLLEAHGSCFAQVGGNVGFAQGNGRTAEVQAEQSKRILSAQDLPPTSSSTFVEANVLMNVRADEYVAVFAVSEEGESVAEAAQKMAATLKGFTDELRGMGFPGENVFVDLIAQNKIYGFEVSGDLARKTRRIRAQEERVDSL